MGARTRVLVIGLDSFDPGLARSWMDQGALPHLSSLADISVRGPVRNPYGMESSANWSCFAYGSGPGVHGLYNGDRYFDWTSYKPANHRPEDIAARPFWSRLAAEGKRSIVVDAPVMSAPPGQDDIAVIDWCAHKPADGGLVLQPRSWPPELIAEIERDYGGDPLGGEMCDYHRPRSAADIARFRDTLIGRVRTKTALTLDLIDRKPWDFFLVVFGEAHCAGHHFWQVHDPANDGGARAIAAKLGDPLRDVYVALDEAVGAIRARAGEDVMLIAYLSHGMERGYTGGRLLDRILARLDGMPEQRRALPLELARRAWRLLPWKLRSRLRPIQGRAYSSIYNLGYRAGHASRSCFEVHVNQRTSGIRINLRGREPAGIVEPGAEYDALCARLALQLAEIVNDETGEKLVSEFARTDHHHAGPKSEGLPDLLVSWNRHAPIRSVSSPAIGRLKHPHPTSRTGDHSPDGMVLVSGPGIAAREIEAAVDVTEIAPSIAGLMGADTASFERRPNRALLPQGS
ncbi:MAG: alkaline phosphatase family protein [Sphingomonadales bacterium]